MNGDLDKLFNSTELIRINKTLSYISFTLKEMVNFTLQVTPRNIPYYILREAISKIEYYKKADERLRVIK